MLKKISGFLIIIGTLSLIYWPKVYHEGFFIPIRYELIYLLAVLFFIADRFKSFNRNIVYSSAERNFFIILSIFLLSIIIATLMSYFKYDLILNFIGATVFLKLLLGVAIFLIVYRLCIENIIFYKRLSFSLALPSLLLVPFLFMPALAEKWGMISYGNRFQGFTENPSAMAMLSIIGFAYSCSFLAYYSFIKKNYLYILLYFFAAIGISMIIFWSQSRSYVFGMLIVMIAILLLYSYYIKKSKIKIMKMISYFIRSMGLFLMALFFVPSHIKESFIFDRLLGAATPSFSENYTRSSFYEREAVNKISMNKIFVVLRDDPRITIWKNYYPFLLIHHPFGIGINYYPQFSYKWINTKHQENDSPPFFLFNIWVLGGMISVGCMCFLFWKSILNFRVTLPCAASSHVPYKIGAILSLSIFWLMSIFNGLSIDYIGFWIVFSLAMI